MRNLSPRAALFLIIVGALAIAASATALAFLPHTELTRFAALIFIALAGLLIAAGFAWHRLQNTAYRALADYLGQELLNLEAVSTTATDEYVAFNEDGVITFSHGMAGLLGLSSLTMADLKAALPSSRLAERIEALLDEGAGFHFIAATGEGLTLSLDGARAKVRPGQPPLFVLRARNMSAQQKAIEAERQLREKAEAEKQALLTRWNNLPLPVWLRDEGLNLVWANQAAGLLLDCSPEQMVAEQREPFLGQLGEDGRWLAEQAELDAQVRQDTAHAIVGGTRHLYQVTEVPLGQPGATLLGFAVDMTRLEEKEAELKRHIAGNAAVLERLGAAIAIYRPDQALAFHNQAFVDLWGLDEAFLRMAPTYGEVLEELRVRRRLPEQADFRRFKADQIALFTSLLEPQEELLYLPDGRMLRALMAPHPFGGLMFVYEDVSRRFELETSLNTMVAVQQETFNNLAEGIAVFGPDGRLKLFNPAYCRIWNLQVEELAGEPHANFVINKIRPFFNVSEAEWPTLHEEMVAVALDRSERKGRVQRADGSVLDYIGTPLPDGSVLHSFLDITDSVRVEEALRESNDALEAADRLKSEFIANITYQLRTPLTAIMGFAEMLNNQYFGKLSEKQLEYTTGIVDAGQRLLTLINDILELASIEAGTLQLERSELEIKPLLQAVTNVAAEWARQEELDLIVKVPEGIGRAWLDERRVRQALFNLLSNAIKFTPSGGRVELSAERQGNQLLLMVSDNGIGIAPADQARIFKRFERANIRTGQAGAGLGLSVVKSIVEMHGGRIEVQSAPNRGSKITCIFPVMEPSLPKAEKASLSDATTE